MGTRTRKKKTTKAADKVKEHPEGKKGKLNQCLTLKSSAAMQGTTAILENVLLM